MTASQIAGPGASRESTGLGAVLRYGGSTCGPMAVSAAHFLASLIFLHDLPAQAFGLFSFVMVTLSFGMSLNLSLVCVPITRSMAIGDRAARSACFQMNWLVCIGFAASLFVGLLLGGAPLHSAGLLALFAGIFTFRWFARSMAYID